MDTNRINDLKHRAEGVRGETQEGGNTALRVGQLIYDVIDYDSQQSNAINTLEIKSNNLQEQIDDIVESGGGGEGSAGAQRTFFYNTSDSGTPELPLVSEYDLITDTFNHNSQVWSSVNTDAEEGEVTWMIWAWFSGSVAQTVSGPVKLNAGGGGSNGEDANETEWVYMRTTIKLTDEAYATWESNLANAKGTNGYGNKNYTQPDVQPTGWTDNPTGIDSLNKYEYASYRTSSIDANGKRVWGTTGFSAPILWAAYGEKGIDGDGVEYIFYANQTGTFNPTQVNYPPSWNENTQGKGGKTFQDNEFIALGSDWTDEPIDLSAAGYGQGSVQWVSMRKKQNDIWQAYSTPAVWSRLGKDGVVDGYVVDPSNGNMPVGTDSNGNVSSWENYCEVQVYHNGVKSQYVSSEVYNIHNLPPAQCFTYTIGTITRSDGGDTSGLSVSKKQGENQTVVVSITSLSNFDGVTAYIPITVLLPDGNTRNTGINVYGVSTGEAGQFIDLVVGAKVIRSNYTGTVVSPTSISVGVMIGERTYWSTYGSPSDSAQAMGYSFSYAYDNGGITYHAGDIPVATGHSNLTVNMYKNNLLIDSETIPYIKDGMDAVSYDIVFEEAWAHVDADNKINGNLAGFVYRIEGTNRAALNGLTVRYGYILDDSDTYVEGTSRYKGAGTDYPGYFTMDGWINDDDAEEFAKGSQSIFAAIIVDGTPVCVKYVPISKDGAKGDKGNKGDNAVTYDLVPSPATAKFYVNSSTNTLSPSSYTIKCKGRKIAGSTSTDFYDQSGIYTIYYRIAYSDGTYSDVTSNTSAGVSVPNVGNNSVNIVAIHFYLASSDNLANAYIVKEVAVPVSRDGLKGESGESSTGQIGKFYFYAGEWESMKAEGGWQIEATATEAPYVYVASENKYYMFTRPLTGSETYTIDDMNDNPQNDPTNWTEIQYNQFSLSDAMFANYAHLGSMIINRDWAISQYGSINGTASSAYKRFDPISFMTKIKGEASIGVITQTGTSLEPLPSSQLFQVKTPCTLYVKGNGSTRLAKINDEYSNFFRFDNSSALPDIYTSIGDYTQVNNNTATTFTISTNGTYCFLNGNLSEIKAVANSNSLANVWIPNYALDLRAGFTYQNNAYVSGVITASALYKKWQVGVPGGTIDPAKGCGIQLPFGIFGEPPLPVVLPSASDFPFLTLSFIGLVGGIVPRNMGDMASIRTSGTDVIWAYTEAEGRDGDHRFEMVTIPPNKIYHFHSMVDRNNEAGWVIEGEEDLCEFVPLNI